MAIIPEDQYPGKITPANPQYPYGQARNITNPSDGTGTPWEQNLVNDLFGFQQALLVAAGIEPSGVPDNAQVSQYLQALLAVVKQNAFATNRNYQNVTATRAVNTTYTNNLPYPIDVCLSRRWGDANLDWVTVTVGGIVVYDKLDEGENSSWVSAINFRVPPGRTYRVDTAPSGSISRWMEL